MADENWLNSVLASPVVGAQVAAKPSSLFRLPSVVGPFLDMLHDQKGNVRIQSNGAETTLETPDGYIHKFVRQGGGIHLVAQFQFSPIERKEPGALPTLAYGSKSFGDALQEVLARMKSMLRAVQALEQTSIRKLGLLAQAELTKSQLPPGVVRYMEWQGKPWQGEKGEVTKSSGSILVRWPEDKSGKFRDQCHHGLHFDLEAAPSEMSLMIDYQRLWKDGIAVSQGASELENLKTSATGYFQDFAFGDRVWTD